DRAASMALSARLQVRQTQSLVITPQLMQAIRLLHMSGVELDRFVASELEQNPLLDAGADAGSSPADAVEELSAAAGPADPIGAALDAEPTDVFPEHTGSDTGWAPGPATRAPTSGASSFDDFGLDQRLP